jgi:hypothetical protein
MVMSNTTHCRQKQMASLTDPCCRKKFFNHLSIKYQATGKAMKHDSPTRKTKFLVIKGTNWPVLCADYFTYAYLFLSLLGRKSN